MWLCSVVQPALDDDVGWDWSTLDWTHWHWVVLVKIRQYPLMMGWNHQGWVTLVDVGQYLSTIDHTCWWYWIDTAWYSSLALWGIWWCGAFDDVRQLRAYSQTMDHTDLVAIVIPLCLLTIWKPSSHYQSLLVKSPYHGWFSFIVIKLSCWAFLLGLQSSFTVLSSGSKPLHWAGIVVIGVPAPHSSPLPWMLWWGFLCCTVAPKPSLYPTLPNMVYYAGIGWRGG